MKKNVLLLLMLACWQITAQAANLLDVYNQALISDPVFQQAIAHRLATKENVPISFATLLPNLTVNANPGFSRTGLSGSQYEPISHFTTGFIAPRNNTIRSYTLNLNVTQTVFNFQQFSTLAGAYVLSKQADADLNAALQNLMTRVASAYFAVLQDEETLNYAEASKIAFAEQLNQMREQFKVGIKTITDVYTAQSSYDTAVSTYINAQTTLANDRENLRVITGIYYPHLWRLSNDFPLISPQPDNIERWVDTSLRQNWKVRSAQYALDNARQVIHQQFAGHLPTVNVQGGFSRQYQDNINGYQTLATRNGPGTINAKQILLSVSMPLFAGGGVVAQTNQATYDYQGAQQQLEQAVRTAANNARQSYLNVMTGISLVTADKHTIASTKRSLAGLEESYRVGTETLVNVLNQQEKVFFAQSHYAKDRYAFVNHILELKQAAGTLGFNDLRAINDWLIDHASKQATTRR